MRPTLLDFHLPLLGRVDFPAYMTFVMFGFMLGIWQLVREARRIGAPPDRYFDLGLWMILFGLLGGRLLAVLADGKLQDFIHLCTDPKLVPIDPHEPESLVRQCTQVANACGDFFKCNADTGRCYPPRDCFAAVKFWLPGLAYYGGFLGASAFGLWYANRHKLGVARTADMSAPFIALGLFFGRLGCFFNGCCYGRQSESSLAVLFPTHPDGARLPMQLAEALGALLLFFALLMLRQRKRKHGHVFAALLVGYGILRFVLEFWRDDPRGGFAGLSTSQLISIPLVALGLSLWRPWQRRATLQTLK